MVCHVIIINYFCLVKEMISAPFSESYDCGNNYNNFNSILVLLYRLTDCCFCYFIISLVIIIESALLITSIKQASDHVLPYFVILVNLLYS